MASKTDLFTNRSAVLKKYMSKRFLLKNHGDMLQQLQQCETAGFMQHLTLSCDPDITLPSVSRIKLVSKNRLTITDLKGFVDVAVIGKFLLCRTISPPLKLAAIVVVLDDPDGHVAVRYSMYNFFPRASFKKLTEILPVGTIMAVKNPYFKTSGDGGYGLRTDDPADVIFFDVQKCKHHFPEIIWKGEIPKIYGHLVVKATVATAKTADEWKALGNDDFVKKNYAGALNAYTSGLKEDPTSVCLLANRSATYLLMLAYEKALIDASEVLKIDPSHTKAIYRKAKALCGLKKYKETEQFLSTFKPSIIKDSKDLSTLLLQVKLYIHQSTTGDYDIPLMITFTEENSATIFDFANYTGPVEVCESPGKGRGLFATADIQPGQLLIGCKAFAQNTTAEQNFNPNNGSLEQEDEELANIVANIIEMAPERGKELYKLYAGPEMGFLNSESGDLTTVVNFPRIKAICRYNIIGGELEQMFRHSRKGLWLSAAMINHSCYDFNCKRIVFGNFMLIRASRPISKGEEILMSYIKSNIPYIDRKQFIEKTGRFVCHCLMCELEKREPEWIHKERKRLLVEYSTMVGAVGNNDNNIHSLYLKELMSLCQKNPDMNTCAVEPMMNMCTDYMINGRFQEAATILGNLIHMLRKFAMFDNAIIFLCTAIVAYAPKVTKDDLAAWIKNINELLALTFGHCDVSDVLLPLAMAKETLQDIGLSLTIA